MGDSQKKILQLLAEGKVSVDEASRLLYLTGEGSRAERPAEESSSKADPKYLYVNVEPKEGHSDRGQRDRSFHDTGRVNVRIPVALIRAGMKLTSLVPPHVADDVNKAMSEKGIRFDLRNLKDQDIEQLIGALSETEINVDSDEATVRVYAQ
jgi:hypothetical protein